MKSLMLFIAICFTMLGANAQVVSGLMPSPDGKMGEFSEWKTVEVDFGDNTHAKIAYRIALVSRVALACNYEVEVKNDSDMKLKITMNSHYYDKLVKSHFGDEVKGVMKPGKSVMAKFRGQGCKKDKGESEAKDDYTHCINCGLTVSISISK